MAQKCLHYNYNSTETCTDSYDQCAKEVDCPKGNHCFVVWNKTETTTTPISAGCNPPYNGDPEGEKCQNECIGQKRGPRYYCCCNTNLCNRKYEQPPTITPPIPPQPTEPSRIGPEFDIFEPPQDNFMWTVIPIVLVVTLVCAFIYRYKRSISNIDTHHDRRNINNTNDNNNNRNVNGHNSHTTWELNELRNNNLNNIHNISIFEPFRNNFGNNNTNKNKSKDKDKDNNNHHHHHHHLNNKNVFDPNQTITIPLLNNNINHDANNHTFNQQQSDNQRIDLNSINLLEVVGSGKFGTVHRALLNNDNPSSEVAIKIISQAGQQSWLNEQQIYQTLYAENTHPNILNFLYSEKHEKTGDYWLIVEYASKGSLYDYLKENTIDWGEFRKIALGISRGLSRLHEANIAHRDFKSKNVLLKHDLTPCVSDFGGATLYYTTTGSQLDHRKKLQVGTPRYMAPEVLECSVTFTKASFIKIDVYALSLVLWELISRCHPLPRPAKTHGSNHHPSSNLSKTVFNNTDHSAIAHTDTARSEQHLNYAGTTATVTQDNPDGHELASRNSPAIDTDERQALPYKLPFEDEAGPAPDINVMLQVVVLDKIRPQIRDEWRVYPVSDICRAIEDGWEYDQDARISASCFVERVESLPPCVY